MNDAGIILAGGAQQIGAVFWAALAVAVLAIAAAGVFFGLFFAGRARWRAMYGGDTQPVREIDEAVAEFGHDLDREIDEMLRRYRRG